MSTNLFRKLKKIQDIAAKKVMSKLNSTNKALVHMATGTGKTEVAVDIITKNFKNKKVLWLTHTNELTNQAVRRIKSKTKLDVNEYTGSKKDSIVNNITVASIPTLSREQSLKKFKKNTFDLVIFDEAHHIPAQSWYKIYNHFKSKKLGLTATPHRPDRQDVIEYFGEPMVELSFNDATDKGFLAPIQNEIVITSSKLGKVSIKGTDYSPEMIDKIVALTGRDKIIVKSYKKYARNKIIESGQVPKVLCFCINMKHAMRMSKVFNKSGIVSKYIVSDIRYQTPVTRDKVFNDFKDTNDIEVLCVVNTFNEGVDVPNVNVGLMCRPTRSNIIFTQQIGRLARLSQGKKFYFVLDFVDNIEREYQPYSVGTLLGKKYKLSQIHTEYVEGEDAIEIQKRVENIMASVEKFENKINEERLKDKDTARKELEYLIKFGKVSKEVYSYEKN